MAEVPKRRACENCDALALKVVTAPYLSQAGSGEFQLIDKSARSAHEPEVTTSLPTRGPGKATPITRNPLHAKLPRP